MVDGEGHTAAVFISPLPDSSPATGFDVHTGDLLKFGYFECSSSGYITIQSSSNLSSSAFVGSVIVHYMPN